jgi:hypothetical protein
MVISHQTLLRMRKKRKSNLLATSGRCLLSFLLAECHGCGGGTVTDLRVFGGGRHQAHGRRLFGLCISGSCLSGYHVGEKTREMFEAVYGDGTKVRQSAE